MDGDDPAAPIIPLADYAERMGPAALRKRLVRQAWRVAGTNPRRSGRPTPEGWGFQKAKLVQRLAQIADVEAWGRRNVCDQRIEKVIHRLANWPKELDGLVILQLSDLHLDVEPRLTEAVVKAIDGLTYDLTVVTGDYRDSNTGDQRECLDFTHEVAKAIQGPAYATLGNHDSIEMVPVLEAFGWDVLLNQGRWLTPLPGSEAGFWLAGIDDSFLYETHDIPRSVVNCPKDAFRLLLAHSPDVYAEARDNAIDLMLCGHTHAGQIRLPGGFPLIWHDKVERRHVRGLWREGNLTGYTARGTGACGAPLRYFCPPEITLHRLEAITPESL